MYIQIPRQLSHSAKLLPWSKIRKHLTLNSQKCLHFFLQVYRLLTLIVSVSFINNIHQLLKYHEKNSPWKNKQQKGLDFLIFNMRTPVLIVILIHLFCIFVNIKYLFVISYLISYIQSMNMEQITISQQLQIGV